MEHTELIATWTAVSDVGGTPALVSIGFDPVVAAFPPTLWPADPTLDGYVKAFDMRSFVRQYFNSLDVSAMVTVGTMLIASLAGYGFARIQFCGQKALFMIVLVGLPVPTEATIVPLSQIFNGLGQTNTHWPILHVSTFGAPSVLAAVVVIAFLRIGICTSNRPYTCSHPNFSHFRKALTRYTDAAGSHGTSNWLQQR